MWKILIGTCLGLFLSLSACQLSRKCRDRFQLAKMWEAKVEEIRFIVFIVILFLTLIYNEIHLER